MARSRLLENSRKIHGNQSTHSKYLQNVSHCDAKTFKYAKTVIKQVNHQLLQTCGST